MDVVTQLAPPHDVERASGMAGALSLRSLSKSFDGTAAVRGLDLDVAPGEFVSLLGPSGCGKTTALRLVAGLEYADTGSITISGQRVDHLPPHRRPVNTVFQSYALFPHMSVADNVAYGPRMRKVTRQELRRRVSEALDLVRMSGHAAKRPGQLSGGQQQRVALARAIVNRPQILLLDEPMSALDRKLREEMQVDLKIMQRDLGMTFVFVTHDQGEALTMSDRLAVMNGGCIEQIGSPADVYDEPVTAFVAGFIGQQNFFPALLTRVDASMTEAVAGGMLVRSTRSVSVPVGSAATVAVRPDDVRVLVIDDAVGPNRLRGTVRTMSKIGHRIHYIIETADGTRIQASGARDTVTPVPPGSVVTCAWGEHAVRVFPADPFA